MKVNAKSQPKVILDDLRNLILRSAGGVKIMGKNTYKLFRLVTGMGAHRSL